ncbi:MAG: hypothetical protein RL514_385 [Verrucomicrobiota bacterium]|jgi:hypothetical protein
MSLGSTKHFLLGAGLLCVAGIAAFVLSKRHDQRLSVASALAVAAVQSQVANATGISGLARGIRIPFYENNAQQPTSVMLGRTAERVGPVADGKYLVTDMRVENYTYGLAGTATNFIIEAPKCLIDPARKVASSDGRMVISRPDGSFLTTGVGFEFRQVDSFLTISNDISTHLSSVGSVLTKPSKP